MGGIRKTIPIVIALIRNDEGQILIAKRKDPALIDEHDKWELVGGKLEWHETPEQAVVREAKEETGLDVEIIRMIPKAFVNYWTKPEGEHKVVLLVYECKVVGGSLHDSESGFDHKVSELKFIDQQELSQYDWLGPVPKIVLESHS